MLNHNPADLIDAGHDAVLAAFGVHVTSPHPLAGDLATAPLSRLAYAAGMKVRPQQGHETDRQVMGRGMQSSDFASLLASASMTLANRRFDAVAEHRKFCSVIEAKDFKPTSIGTADGDGELPEVGDAGTITQGSVVFGNGASARLRTFARILRASRTLIINDQAGILADAAAQLGTAGARTEGREVYAALEANPTLDDGELVFHADHNNLVASALDSTSLGTAMSSLRTMTLIAGNQADLTAAHLVVAADLELAARKLVHDSGLEIGVTATSRLPTGRWYLLPAPDVAPVVGVLKLKGAANSIRIEPWADEFAFDGVVMRGTVDTGAVLVARTAIKGGA